MKRKVSWFHATLVGSLVFFSCQKEAIQRPEIDEVAGQSNQSLKFNVFKGPEVAIGNGYARSWIRINHLDQPDEIGVELTAAALTGLPGHREGLVLPLHQKAGSVTPFDHIGLDYHPAGHPPPGIFSVEHFDAHFYMMSLEERLAIPPVSPATLPLFNLAPPAAYMPVDYFPGGPDPKMGKHWSPPPASFSPFTRVMIYGTYNGAVTFVEPMVTTTHLQSNGSSQAYTQPERFAIAGNYPTRYNIYTDPNSGNYNITLTDFVARPAD